MSQAEQSGVSRPTTPNAADMFFCHVCLQRVNNVSAEFECPRCNSGFLERVEEAEGGGSSRGNSSPASADNDHAQFEQMVGVQLMGQLMGMLGGGQGVGPFVRQDHQSSASGTEHQNTSSASGRPPVPGQSTSAPFNLVNPMQMFLHQLINNLGAGGGQFQVQIHQGPDGFQIGPMLHGNPGDYAWGPNGIDQIVTQLLNQFEGSSQPMSEEDIAKLPTVNIDQETVDKSTQCATCFENFKLDEPVRQLACLHVFHDECIVPWLRNHSTCPICRMSFEASARAGGGSQRQDSTTLQGGAGGGLQGLLSTVAAAFGGNSNSNAAASAQTQTQAQVPFSAPAPTSTSSAQRRQQQQSTASTTTSSSRPATGEQRDIVDQIDELD